MIRVVLIGFGGIAKAAHFPVYKKLEKEGIARLVAICDLSPAAFASGTETNIGEAEKADTAGIRTYTDLSEMLVTEKPDMADICVPTDRHATVACAALRAGCHVLSEKPMSLSYADCSAIIETAEACGKALMVAQCLRFSRRYGYLKTAVKKGTFGKIRGGVFRRLSPPPVWGSDNWYMDFRRSHGCILDLHIHDIDMIRYLCGEPLAVSCQTQDICSKMDIAYSVLRYEDFSLLAIGDWTGEGLPFLADFRVVFERATVESAGDTVTVCPRGETPFTLDFSGDDYYENEIRFFLDALTKSDPKATLAAVNPPESAALSVRLIETLTRSATAKGTVLPFRGAETEAAK